jgi:hypothetical protein
MRLPSVTTTLTSQLYELLSLHTHQRNSKTYQQLPYFFLSMRFTHSILVLTALLGFAMAKPNRGKPVGAHYPDCGAPFCKSRKLVLLSHLKADVPAPAPALTIEVEEHKE